MYDIEEEGIETLRFFFSLLLYLQIPSQLLLSPRICLFPDFLFLLFPYSPRPNQVNQTNQVK